MRVLGGEVYGYPTNLSKGVNAVLQWCADRNISVEGLHFDDSSGLSRKTRCTARTILQTLQSFSHDFALGPDFVASLGVSGAAGTIKKRMREPAFLRKVRGKTGHILGVCTLAGYVETSQKEVLAYVIFFNDLKCSWNEAKSLQDRICETLVKGA